MFVINRNWEQDTALELDVSGFTVTGLWNRSSSSRTIRKPPHPRNPNAIAPSVSTVGVCRDGKVDTTVKKLSWNVFRFKKLV